MTTVAEARRATPRSRAGQATGTGRLLWFALRRDRVRLPLWVASAAAFVGVQSASSQDVYADVAALEQYARTAAGSAAVVAMTGRPVGIDSVARAVAFEVFAVVAVLVALMSVFTVVRHTRADEAEGRAELVRATAVGRRAPLLAALLLTAVADLGVVVAVWAVGVATGLPSAGSLLLGASLGAVGLVHGAAAAVAAQLSSSARGALSAGGALVGAAFLVRAAGDVREDALSWLSPIGWAQATYPFHLDRWWPLLLCLAAAGLLSLLAVTLQDRRDLGAGLLPERRGPATARRWLGTPVGLAWRLQRGTVLGWAAGLAVTGLAYGSLVAATEELVAQNPEIVEFIPGGRRDVVAGYLVLTAQLVVFLAACAGVALVSRLTLEERSGGAEAVLATATSRRSWAGAHVLLATAGPGAAAVVAALLVGAAAVATGAGAGVVPDVLLAVLVLLPCAWVLVGVAVLLWGAGAGLVRLAWLAVGWCAVVLVLADSLDLPGWLRDLSPFSRVPAVPLEDASAGPSLVLLGLAAVLVAAGLVLGSRRDVRTG